MVATDLAMTGDLELEYVDRPSESSLKEWLEREYPIPLRVGVSKVSSIHPCPRVRHLLGEV